METDSGNGTVGRNRNADIPRSASLPADFEIAPEWDVCLASIARPAAQPQERIKMLMERDFTRRVMREPARGDHR